MTHPDVLSYVLRIALESGFDGFSEPAACKAMLGDTRIENSPVEQFVHEIAPQLQWVALPKAFIWDLFTAWYKRRFNKAPGLSERSFLQEFWQLLKESGEWEYWADGVKDATKQTRFARVRCIGTKCEPLIAEYGLQYDKRMYRRTVRYSDGVYTARNDNTVCIYDLGEAVYVWDWDPTMPDYYKGFVQKEAIERIVAAQKKEGQDA